MSFSSSGFGSSRRLRAPSTGSHSSPQLIPGCSDSVDGTSNATSDGAYGSFRAHQDGQNSTLSPAIASGQREPTRSSVHLSYRGGLGMIAVSSKMLLCIDYLHNPCRQRTLCSKCSRRYSRVGLICSFRQSIRAKCFPTTTPRTDTTRILFRPGI